jgi:hypothetical protein
LLLDILSFDLLQIFTQVLEKIKSDKKKSRFLEVLQKRANGKSLQDIAKTMNMTKEGIRQMEIKGIKALNDYLNGTDILAFIDTNNNLEKIITIEELNHFLGNIEHSNLFIFAIKSNQLWSTYKFIKQLNIFCHSGLLDEINNILNRIPELPIIITKDEKNAMLLSICGDNNLPQKAVALIFSNIYEQTKKIYHRERLSLTTMYDYILKKCYPSGIRLFDDNAIKHFKKRVVDTFGKIKLSENGNAILARISSFSILCGRGTYIHSHCINIDNNILHKIEKYIDTSQRDVYSFNELFETFKRDLFLKSNINNKYFLQGVLNNKLCNKYYFSRNTISKKREKLLSDELEEFIKCKEKVHKEEILSEFKGITQVMFYMEIYKNKNIIYLGDGWYSHSKRLDLNHSDYKIKKYIDKAIEAGPISARKLLELFWETNTKFLTKNSIDNHEKFYSVLRFMFADNYIFSRHYISPLGKEVISNKNVIK